jgi:predicted nicotinamide N-methyase
VKRESLRTAAGELAVEEYRLRLAGREWTILHAGAVLTLEDEQRVLSETNRPPYGFALWPAAIALAHEIAGRADAFRGRSVLELGAGTGLPGIVAASLGARVVQTDKHELALSICRGNGRLNGVDSIEYRQADWTQWDEAARYEWIIGADVLYSEPMHPHLRAIFDANLAPGGRILVADPFRSASLGVLEALEKDGWRIEMTKWNVGEEGSPRPFGAFELTRAPGLETPLPSRP